MKHLNLGLNGIPNDIRSEFLLCTSIYYEARKNIYICQFFVNRFVSLLASPSCRVSVILSGDLRAHKGYPDAIHQRATVCGIHAVATLCPLTRL